MSDPLRIPVVVDDPDDPRIRDFIGLRDRDLRLRDRATSADPEPQSSMFVAEGDSVVARAVRAGPGEVVPVDTELAP